MDSSRNTNGYRYLLSKSTNMSTLEGESSRLYSTLRRLPIPHNPLWKRQEHIAGKFNIWCGFFVESPALSTILSHITQPIWCGRRWHLHPKYQPGIHYIMWYVSRERDLVKSNGTYTNDIIGLGYRDCSVDGPMNRHWMLKVQVSKCGESTPLTWKRLVLLAPWW